MKTHPKTGEPLFDLERIAVRKEKRRTFKKRKPEQPVQLIPY
jgi:hypothetical protein